MKNLVLIVWADGFAIQVERNWGGVTPVEQTQVGLRLINLHNRVF